MELYFLRHGRSVSRGDWNDDDAERPLTEEGEGALAHEAATFLRLGLRPDLVVSSPLLRARQTAEIAARGMEIAGRVIVDERVGEGLGLKRLRRVLRDHDGAERIMIVGHEPDLSTVVRKLTGGSVVCTKGSLVRVDMADAEAQKGRLVWLLQAETLIGQALAPPIPTAVAAPSSGDSSPPEGTEYGEHTAVAPSGERVPLLEDVEGEPAGGDAEPAEADGDAGKAAA
jgi:phosphohistidine phosphatase